MGNAGTPSFPTGHVPGKQLSIPRGSLKPRVLPRGPEGGRWPLLGLSGPGWAQARALPGTRRGPHQGQVPERRCTSLYNGPGKRATPTSWTWGPGLSNGPSQPGPSSPGRTEGEAAEVLNLSPTQHCVPGRGGSNPLHSAAGPCQPQSHPRLQSPPCPGLTQSSPQRHTQPRILATAGGKT